MNAHNSFIFSSKTCEQPKRPLYSSYRNKMPQIGWFKQQELISHSSSGWEVQDQGARQFVPFESSLLGLQVAAFLLHLHTAFFSVLTEERKSSLVSLLIKPLILLDLSPTLMTSFNLNHFLRGPVSKYRHTGD